MPDNPGKLFYLMGASGAGKDSIMSSARQLIDPRAPIAFAHRYITRPFELEGENHIALSESEFDRLLRHDCFAMHWTSNCLRYGIGVEIDYWLKSGLNVVVNGSREYFSEAARMQLELYPVLIWAYEKLLRERLIRRGRESSKEIERRLVRTRKLDALIHHPRLTRLDNNGPLEEAALKLITLLSSHAYRADSKGR